MRFYTKQHQFYGGIDLHARAMYVCILNQSGEILVHRNMKTTPETFLNVIAPYREGLVVAVECMFTWYWLADLCTHEGMVMFQMCCFLIHNTMPNSSRLTNNPITISCSSIDFEKPMVFRINRFSLVRKVRCFRSIFCVCIFPTVCCSGFR